MKFMAWAARLSFVAALIAASPLSAQEPAADQAQSAPPAITRLADLSITVEDIAPGEVPTHDFAARSAYRSFSMSPDGVHLVTKRIFEGTTDLLIIDAATKAPLKVFKFDPEQEVDWFRWAGNDKIIMSISMRGMYYDIPVRVNRLLVRNIVNNETFMLDVPDELLWGGDLIHVDEAGSYALVSLQYTRQSDPSVYRYELVPGAKRERVVKPVGGVWDWYADDAGVVRLGMGWRNKRLRIYYRETENDDFELVDKLREDDERSRYWNVVQIVSGSDRGYVLEEGENGRIGVRLFDYSTGEVIETFYENPDWDVEELWLNRDGTPLAALYTDDRERIEWFDPDMAKLHRDLGRALQMEDLRIVTRSRNNERMLVWGGSEADPGALYLFSPEEKRLDLLGDYRPELDFQKLARSYPVRYRARDGLMISAYLTLPRGREPRDLPLIVMPHGGPFGVRDLLQYNDEVQLLANRGYAVLQPNFRGSGGYGEAFYQAGVGQVGRAMQDDIDDAMDWAVNEGIADGGRVCVVGGSYGGFAALWAVIRNPERYRCAASWAGVTDWDRMLSYDRRYLGRKRARDLRERVEGEDFDLDAYSPVNHAANLSRPVLLAHGSEDQRVPASQFFSFERAAKDASVPVETLMIEGEGHSFTKAENEQQWYDALVAFLAQHNPADPSPVAQPAAQTAQGGM